MTVLCDPRNAQVSTLPPRTADKLKVQLPFHAMKHKEEQRYGSIHSSARYEIEGSGQLHAPCRYTPREGTPVLIEWEAGWAPEPVWTVSENIKYIFPTWIRTPGSSSP